LKDIENINDNYSKEVNNIDIENNENFYKNETKYEKFCREKGKIHQQYPMNLIKKIEEIQKNDDDLSEEKNNK